MFEKFAHAAVFVVALVGADAASADQIRIGIEGAFPPWNALDAQNKLTGMDVDIITDLCARAALDCDLVAGPWKGMVPGLNAGKYDAIMTIGINEERKKVIDFTIPYAQGMATFLVLADSSLAMLPARGTFVNLTTDETANTLMEDIGSQIKGSKIGVVGSTSQERLINTWFGDTVEVKTYESSAARDLDLRSGRLDAGFDSAIYAAAMLAEPGNDDLTMTGPLLRGSVLATDVAIGVRKGEEALRDQFSDAIRAAAEAGVIREASMAWAHIDLTPETN